MSGLVPYGNTARLEYDMACYGVDACILLPAFGMTDELNLEIVELARALCGRLRRDRLHGALPRRRGGVVDRGVCAELDRLLATGRFVAIGESMPYMPLPYDSKRPVSRVDAVTNMLAIAEVAARHKVALRYHTGIPMGYTAAYSYGFLGCQLEPAVGARHRGRVPRPDADLRPWRHPGLVVGALV